MLHEILNMDWPIASVLIAAILAAVVVYAIKKSDGAG